MKIFLDTADINEIKRLAPTGMVDGVTTNPSLIAKSSSDILATIKEICAEVSGPVSAEVTATDYDTMLKEGLKLADLADNVAVKVPLTIDGLKVCKTLSDQDHGECDIMFFKRTSLIGRESWCQLYLAICRAPR